MSSIAPSAASPLDFSFLNSEVRKTVVADFSGGNLTSDGGNLLLAQADRVTGVCSSLAASMGDKRRPGRVSHSLVSLLRTRVGAIALDYVDCNDANYLRHDSGSAVFAGKLPLCEGLPSSSTLSRLENSLTKRQMLHLAVALARCILRQLPADAPLIYVDVDGTDVECHGNQVAAGFNKHYGHNCFMPLLVHVSLPGGQIWTVTSYLRSGKSGNTRGFCFVVAHVLTLLRERCPRAQIVVRADAGFGSWEIVKFLEKKKVKYALGWRASESVERRTQHVANMATAKFNRYPGCYLPDSQLNEKQLAARHQWKMRLKENPVSSSRKRRTECVAYGRAIDSLSQDEDGDSHGRWIIAKVKALPFLGSSHLQHHYLMTNLSPATNECLEGLRWAREVHPFYCLRGDEENRIKEWKLDLRAGRPSCHRFLANQFRLLLHTASLFLLGVLQANMPKTKRFANLQVGTLRTHLLKVAAKVSVTCRRVYIQLPSSYPYKDIWRQLNINLLALAGPTN